MKKHITIAFLLLVSLFVQSQSLPINKQPMVWLRADIPGDSLGFWLNLSSNKYHATRTGQVNLPDTTAFNFHNSFLLPTGSTPFTINNYFPSQKEKYSIYIAYKVFDTINVDFEKAITTINNIPKLYRK